MGQRWNANTIRHLSILGCTSLMPLRYRYIRDGFKRGETKGEVHLTKS
jgi:hypothetical protein